jgi:TP901 family phage tail tape measure protein
MPTVASMAIALGLDDTDLIAGLARDAKAITDFEKETTRRFRDMGGRLRDSSGRFISINAGIPELRAELQQGRSVLQGFVNESREIMEGVGIIDAARVAREGNRAGQAFTDSLKARVTALRDQNLLPPEVAARLIGQMNALGRNAGEAYRRALEDRIRERGQALQSAGTALTIGVTAPILGIGAAAFKGALTFETAMAQVRRTTDLTEVELEGLGKEFRALSRLPGFRSAESLAELGALGAQLGIVESHLAEFTTAIVQLDLSTNLDAEAGATALARLSNIMGTSARDASRLGSALVALGADGASTEREIVDMALRIAGAGRTIGLSEGDVLGLASALSSVGIEVEAGGTAISRVMIQMAQAVAEGGRDLDNFSKVAGVSAADFSTAFGRDAAGTLVDFIEGLRGVAEAGQNVFAVLETLNVDDVRVRDALLRAASASGEFRRQLETGNDAFAKGTALQTAFLAVAATIPEQLKALGRELFDVARTLGNALLPYLQAGVDLFRGLVGPLEAAAAAFASLPGPLQAGAIGILAVAAAVGPALVLVGRLAQSFVFLRSASFILTQAGGLASIGALLTPGGLILGGLGILSLLLYESGRAAREAQAKIDAYRASLAGLSQIRLIDLAASIEGQVDELRERKQEIERLLLATPARVVESGTGFSRIIDSHRELREELGLINGQISELEGNQRVVADQFNAGAAAAEQMKTQAEELAKALEKAMKDLDLDTSKPKTALERMQEAAQLVTERLDAIRDRTDGAADRMARLAAPTAAVRDLLALAERHIKAVGEAKIDPGFLRIAEQLRDALGQAPVFLQELVSAATAAGKQIDFVLARGIKGPLRERAFEQVRAQLATLLTQSSLFGGMGAAPLAIVGAQVQLSISMIDPDPFREITKEADAAAARLSAILSLGVEGPIKTGAIARVQGAITKLDDLIGSLGDEDDAPQALVDLLAKLRQILKDMGMEEINAAAKRAQELLQGLGSIASGVGEVAGAMGLLNDSLSRTLQGTERLIGGVQQLQAAVNSTQALGAGLGLFAGALNILGGLFGQSPEDKAMRDALNENSKKLQELRDGLLHFEVGASQFLDAARAAARIAADPEIQRELAAQGGVILPGQHISGFLDERLREMGLTWTQFQRIADDMGITLEVNGIVLSTAFEQVAEAAGITAESLTRMSNSIDAQRRAGDLRAQLLGNDSPVEAAARELMLLINASRDLGQSFQGLDLSTQEGRDAARRAALGLLDRIETGQLSPDMLGTFADADAVVAWIDEFTDALDTIVPKVTAFADALDEQRARLSLRAKLFDTDSPAATIERELSLLAQFAPSLAQTFAGLDAETVEGRAAIQRALQSLFLAIEQGLLSEEALGELAGLEDLLGIIGNVDSALDEFREATEAATGSLRNVPDIFKLALRSAESALAETRAPASVLDSLAPFPIDGPIFEPRPTTTTGVTIPVQEFNVTLVAGDRDAEELLDEMVVVLRRRSLAAFGTSTRGVELIQ